jgi:hypothetical protein
MPTEQDLDGLMEELMRRKEEQDTEDAVQRGMGSAKVAGANPYEQGYYDVPTTSDNFYTDRYQGDMARQLLLDTMTPPPDWRNMQAPAPPAPSLGGPIAGRATPEYQASAKVVRERPDWIDNPPATAMVDSSWPGFTMNTSRTMAGNNLRESVARDRLGLGPTDPLDATVRGVSPSNYWTNPEDGRTYVMADTQGVDVVNNLVNAVRDTTAQDTTRADTTRRAFDEHPVQRQLQEFRHPEGPGMDMDIDAMVKRMNRRRELMRRKREGTLTSGEKAELQRMMDEMFNF